MHVKVEQRHINAAIDKVKKARTENEYFDICRDCPIAQALKEVISDFDAVGYNEIRLKGNIYIYMTTNREAVYDAISEFGFENKFHLFPTIEFDVE